MKPPLDFGKIMEKIDKNDKVTLFAGDVKLFEMSIKGIFGNLQIKASSKEPYTIKIKAKIQAGNNFLKTELYGIMTYEELLKVRLSQNEFMKSSIFQNSN